MAHDTHSTPEAESKKTTTSFRSAIWFVIILAGLFIAAVNFVTVMSHDEAEGHDGGHGTEHATEHAAPAAGAHEEHAAEAHGEAAADTTHAAY